MGPEKTRAKHSPDHSGKKQGSFEIALPIRLGIAAVLAIGSALFNMPVLVRIILLALSVLIAGYDIFLAAVDDVAEKNYFSTSLVIVFTAVLAFVIGYSVEAALMVILYQLSKILIDYTKSRSIRSAKSLIDYQDEDVKTRLEEILSEEDIGKMKFRIPLRAVQDLF